VNQISQKLSSRSPRFVVSADHEGGCGAGDLPNEGAETRVRLQTLWDEAALAFVRADLLAAAELYGRIGSLRDEAMVARRPARRQPLGEGLREDGEERMKSGAACVA
jgi:hypothetical protein